MSGVKHSLAGIKDSACGSDLTLTPLRAANSARLTDSMTD